MTPLSLGTETTISGIEFTIYGEAKPKGSLRFLGPGRKPIEQVKGSTEWKEFVARTAKVHMRGAAPILGPVSVNATVCLTRPKSHKVDSKPTTRSSGDVDKLARNLLDAISGVVVKDDSQVTLLTIHKIYLATPPCVYLRVESLTPPPRSDRFTRISRGAR